MNLPRTLLRSYYFYHNMHVIIKIQKKCNQYDSVYVYIYLFTNIVRGCKNNKHIVNKILHCHNLFCKEKDNLHITARFALNCHVHAIAKANYPRK